MRSSVALALRFLVPLTAVACSRASVEKQLTPGSSPIPVIATAADVDDIVAEVSFTYSQVAAAVQSGDIIFQESRSKQSEAIRQATGSRYTHVGLVFGAGTDAPHVLEAVQPVRRTPLRDWIMRGHGAHFVLMRLRDSEHLDVAGLQRAAEKFLGRSYDTTFDWSDDRIYCSELVWKAYERAAHIHIGELEPWRALNLNAAAAKRLADKRLGHKPDPNALVVTPVRLMQSDRLERVMTATLQ